MLKSIVVAVSLLCATGAVAGDKNTNTNTSGSNSGAYAGVNVQSGKSYRSTGAAIAPGLAVGGYSCQGSTSAAAAGSGWGISFGTTRMDRDCNTRENVKLAAGLGGVALARRVACKIEDIAPYLPECNARSARSVSSFRTTTRVAGYSYGKRKPVGSVRRELKSSSWR